jgi:hypothetical protein
VTSQSRSVSDTYHKHNYEELVSYLGFSPLSIEMELKTFLNIQTLLSLEFKCCFFKQLSYLI